MLSFDMFFCAGPHACCYALTSSLAQDHMLDATLWHFRLHLTTHLVLRLTCFCFCPQTLMLGFDIFPCVWPCCYAWHLLLRSTWAVCAILAVMLELYKMNVVVAGKAENMTSMRHLFTGALYRLSWQDLDERSLYKMSWYPWTSWQDLWERSLYRSSAEGCATRRKNVSGWAPEARDIPSANWARRYSQSDPTCRASAEGCVNLQTWNPLRLKKSEFKPDTLASASQ